MHGERGVKFLNPIRNRRGQAIVEMALILPVLLYLMVFTVYAFLVLSDYLTLQSMAREAARMGAVSDQIVWMTNYYHGNSLPVSNAEKAQYEKAQKLQKEVQQEINRLGALRLYQLDMEGMSGVSDDGEVIRRGNVTVSIVNQDKSKSPYISVVMRVRRKDDVPNLFNVLGMKRLFFPPAYLSYGCETPLERAQTYHDSNP